MCLCVFSVSHAVWIWQSVWRLHLPVCQQSVCEPGVEMRRHGRLWRLLRWSQLWWGGRIYAQLFWSYSVYKFLHERLSFCFPAESEKVQLQYVGAAVCCANLCSVLQLLPLMFQAALGISSMSAETDAVFQRGGSVTERMTAGTGLTRPSVQVHV